MQSRKGIALKLDLRRNCLRCNNPIPVPRTGRDYCCQKCYHTARTEAVPQTTCPVCSAPVHATMKAGQRQIYCSPECSRQAHLAEDHPNWSGGRHVDPQGYIRLRVAPGKYRREHRVVAEEREGRTLLPSEHVHHEDRCKTNNEPENLAVLDIREHGRLHGEDRQPDQPRVCDQCGRVRRHQAKGLCPSCYTRANLQVRFQADPEGTRAKLKETNHQSYLRRKARCKPLP